MFKEKNIVIIIGNNGSTVTFFSHGKVINKFLLEELNNVAKEELKKVLSKHRDFPIYIYLDTIDQSYKKKSFPNIKKSDVAQLVRREMAHDLDHVSLKNFLIFDKKKYLEQKDLSSKRWECLYISSSTNESIDGWLKFLNEFPNYIVGMYMLPVEAFNLAQKLVQDNKKLTKNNFAKAEKINFLIFETKVGGIRQIIFSDEGIVFTRVVDFNLKSEEFKEKYEKDFYTTLEYLKRISNNVSINNITIYNIFDQETINKIKEIPNPELNLVNFTPYEAANTIGFKNLVQQSTQTCDLILAKSFSIGKKILRFENKLITSLDKLFNIIKFGRYFNFILLLALLLSAGSMTYKLREATNSLSIKEELRLQKQINLNNLQKTTIEGNKIIKQEKEIDIDRVADFGRIEEFLGNKKPNLGKSYVELKIIRDFNVRLNSISYSIADFSPQNPPQKVHKQLSLKADILNKSGDIESLFTEFDNFSVAIKNRYKDKKITISEIPRNIDFNKKYYSFPIDFSITQSE